MDRWDREYDYRMACITCVEQMQFTDVSEAGASNSA